jgi:hypothetical protein
VYLERKDMSINKHFVLGLAVQVWWPVLSLSAMMSLIETSNRLTQQAERLKSVLL